MTDSEVPLRQLRHDISNPLAAILAEAQLQLLDEQALAPEVAKSFRQIERLSRTIREILQDAL